MKWSVLDRIVFGSGLFVELPQCRPILVIGADRLDAPALTLVIPKSNTLIHSPWCSR